MGLENIPHKISRRKIRYPRIEFTTGELHLVLPINARSEDLLNNHESWIQTKRAFIAECLKESERRELVPRSDEEFKGLVLSLIIRAADGLNVKLNNVIFRSLRTKWASLSANKNLIINKLGRKLPERLLEYIIFHELAHLKQKRHNDHYWEIVGREFPDHQALEKELFVYWFRLISERKKRC
jgi:predicted metal-dependent hydrolase